MIDISIIICTYNPSEAIFSQCLKYLNKALLGLNNYEIIIVNNNSTNEFVKLPYFQEFLREHNTNIKVIQELNQGLTPARIAGIEASKSDLLVFIDDDNLVTQNFLEQGLKIKKEFPFIGAWSGQVLLQFEQKPEPWTQKYWGLLVYREFRERRWSNLPHLSDTMPCGAGLFIIKDVGNYYLGLHKNGLRNIQLDRSGNSLFSGGDNDLAACACDIGLGVGLFPDLVLYHAIPTSRLKEDYLLKLAKGISSSSIVFKSFRGEVQRNPTRRTMIANFLRKILMTKKDRKFFEAVLEGEKYGREMLNKNR